RAHHLAIDRRTDAGCMRADERQLQLRLAQRCDSRAGEGAEAGRYPVDGLARARGALHARAAALHPLTRGGGEGDLFAVPGDGDDLVLREAWPSQRYRHVAKVAPPDGPDNPAHRSPASSDRRDYSMFFSASRLLRPESRDWCSRTYRAISCGSVHAYWRR